METIMGEQSRRTSPGGGAMRTNHGAGIMDKESWRTNHGGGTSRDIMGKKS